MEFSSWGEVGGGPGKMTPKVEKKLMRKIMEVCLSRKRERRTRKRRRPCVVIFDTRYFEMYGRTD